MRDDARLSALVTGFEPFAASAACASWEEVRALPETLGLAGGVLQVHREPLPASLTRAPARTRELLDELRPDIVIHVGRDAGSTQLELGTAAVNDQCAVIPDADGHRPHHVPVSSGSPPSLTATWPAAVLAGRLRAAGYEAGVSQDVGRHVCNATLYASLQACLQAGSNLCPADKETCLPPQVGLLHVPAQDALFPSRTAGALTLLLTELADLVRRARAHGAGRSRLSVPRPRRPLRVGLTGGIGSGKSTVARLLAARGAVVVDADLLAREVLEPGTEGLEEVASAFGPAVLRADGHLDRSALAAAVFNDPSALRRLETITHPRIAQEAAQRMDQVEAGQVALYDVPLLAEGNMADLFDAVIVVEADTQVRLARLEGRGLSRQDAVRRIRAQSGDEQRREVSDLVVENNSSYEDLTRVVNGLWDHHLNVYDIKTARDQADDMARRVR